MPVHVTLDTPFEKEYHQFMNDQVTINQAVATSLARLETLVSQLIALAEQKETEGKAALDAANQATSDRLNAIAALITQVPGLPSSPSAPLPAAPVGFVLPRDPSTLPLLDQHGQPVTVPALPTPGDL